MDFFKKRLKNNRLRKIAKYLLLVAIVFIAFSVIEAIIPEGNHTLKLLIELLVAFIFAIIALPFGEHVDKLMASKRDQHKPDVVNLSISIECVKEINNIINNRKTQHSFEIKPKHISWKKRETINKDFELIKGRDLYDLLKNSPSNLHIITGESGIGKTMALRNFIKRSSGKKIRKKECVPILLSFSKWEEDSFENWIRRNINEEYQNRRIINIDSLLLGKDEISLINGTVEIFFVIDGFDEIPQKDKISCFNEVRQFSLNHNVIISSKPEKAFDRIFLEDEKPVFYELQRLSDSFVNELIKKQSIEAQITVKEVLGEKEWIREWINIPLWLNIILVLGPNIRDVSENEANRSNLFWEEFEKKMYEKPFGGYQNASLSDSEKNSMKAFLALMAAKNKSSTFSSESIQASWLEQKKEKLAYLYLSRTLSSLLLIVTAGILVPPATGHIAAGLWGGCWLVLFTLVRNRLLHRIRLRPIKRFKFVRKTILLWVLFTIVFGVYYGVSTRRAESLEIVGLYFSGSEALVGFLMALFFCMFFGNRFAMQAGENDINKIHTDEASISVKFKRFLRQGLWGGFVAGFLGGFQGILILALPTEFSKGWVSSMHMHFPGGIYCFGFLLYLILGFPIFGLSNKSILKTPSELHEEVLPQRRRKDHDDRLFLKYIKVAINNAAVSSFFLTVSFSVIAFFINEWSIDGLIKGARIGICFGILLGLWFGIIDLIHHFCIRAIFWINGYGPFNIRKQIRQATSLGFIVRTNNGFQFKHDTLKQYFVDAYNQGSNNRKKPTWKVCINVIFFISALFCVGVPVYKICVSGWTTNDDLAKRRHLQFLNVNNIKEISNRADSGATICIEEDGDYIITVTGQVKLGTWIGYEDAEGTKVGFFALPLGTVWNKEPHLPHGALMYRKSNKPWEAVVPRSSSNFYSQERTSDTIHFLYGDTVYFQLNDKEWRNHQDSFQVRIAKIEN